MSEETVSFKDGVIEQQTRKIKLLNAVKASGSRDAASWLAYLTFSTSLIPPPSSPGGKASEWAALAKLYTSAMSSLKGTDQHACAFRIRIGLAAVTR